MYGCEYLNQNTICANQKSCDMNDVVQCRKALGPEILKNWLTPFLKPGQFSGNPSKYCCSTCMAKIHEQKFGVKGKDTRDWMKMNCKHILTEQKNIKYSKKYLMNIFQSPL